MLVTALAMLIALAMVELLLPLFDNFLDADLALSYFGAGGVLLPVARPGPGRRRRSAASIRLSTCRASSRRAVLKANKSLGRGAGLRAASQRPRRRPVRGLDRPHHLHRRHLRARPSTPATADRRLQPRTACSSSQELARRAGCSRSGETLQREVAQARRASRARRPHRDRRRARQQFGDLRLWCPAAPKPVDLGIYAVDHEFLPDDGDGDARRPQLLRRRSRWTTRPLPFPADNAAEQALRASAATNIVVSEAAAQRLGFSDPQQAIGKTISAGADDWTSSGSSTRPSSESSRTPASARSREPLEPIMFLITRNGFNTHGGPLRRHGSERRSMADVERVWKRLLPDVPFEAEFADDRVARALRARRGARPDFRAPSPCSRS